MTEANPLAADLDHVLALTQGLWEELRGQRVFITGGTGFFGCWLLESFAWANNRLNLDATAVVLTRSVERFQRKAPHLASHPAIHFHIGDVRDFDFPDGHFAHVIHAATEASATLNAENPLLMLDTIVEGTRHTLEFARQCGATKFLLTSSGAVYGRQPPNMTHVAEDYPGAPDPANPRSVYGEGKRLAELLCAIYAQSLGLGVKIARCFAFVGPYLPLDAHYAIGNFIRDALCGGPIKVKGDGTPYRSYLYAADLAIGLWTILLRGECRPYNVGSEEALTIAELAYLIAQRFPQPMAVEFGKTVTIGQSAERYVPRVERARVMLGLDQRISLLEAIQRTVAWYSRSSY